MAKLWYPVIDYVLCKECGTCIKKCAHGVYDKKKAPTPVVINPDGCINRCHGCGALCPAGAITYVGDNTGWTPPHTAVRKERAACSCFSGEEIKKIIVDFLYLDLSTCERCKSTDSTLKAAVDEISLVLKTLGYVVTVNSVNITSREDAERYRFLSSPTIRVNGADICAEITENTCVSCGDICGTDVDCRVFDFNGKKYEHPPKAMIIDGILRAIYGTKHSSLASDYTIPENLNKFFSASKKACRC